MPTEGDPGKEKIEAESFLPKGQLLVDVTCVPALIKYPTDLHLLNAAREKTEVLIDQLQACRVTPTKKTRTYRQKARRGYLRVAKAKKPKRLQLRQGMGKQFRFIRRYLRTIASMAQEGLLVSFPLKRYRQLLIFQELYRPQLCMYTHRQYRIADRIVSISQAHVRHLLVRIGSLLNFSWWPGWMVPGKARLVVKKDAMHADVSDRGGGSLAAREGRAFPNWPLGDERMRGSAFFSKP